MKMMQQLQRSLFWNNDQLSSRVAYYFGADLLILLSDIDGYYDKDPKYADATIAKSGSRD